MLLLLLGHLLLRGLLGQVFGKFGFLGVSQLLVREVLTSEQEHLLVETADHRDLRLLLFLLLDFSLGLGQRCHRILGGRGT